MTTTSTAALRPEVVALWTSLGSTIEEMAAGDFHHQDGTPFTDAERELVNSATLAEVKAAHQELEADQARLQAAGAVMDRIGEITRPYWATHSDDTTISDLMPHMTDAEQTEMRTLLGLIGDTDADLGGGWTRQGHYAVWVGPLRPEFSQQHRDVIRVSTWRRDDDRRWTRIETGSIDDARSLDELLADDGYALDGVELDDAGFAVFVKILGAVPRPRV
jgi:hypothetical protein